MLPHVVAHVENVGTWLDRLAMRSPDRAALADSDRTRSFAELASRAARLAGWLGRAGIGRGDRVALLLGNRAAFVEAVFACARIGAIALPTNVRLAPPEIRHLFDDATPKLLLHEASLEERVEAACRLAASPPASRLAVGGEPDAYEAAIAGEAEAPPAAGVGAEEPMLLLYTSGTTGAPKGALLPHRKTLYNCLNASRYFELTAHDRVLVPLPLFHSFGLTIMTLPALHVGAFVRLERRFDAAATWARVESERTTLLGAVPTMFQALLEALEAASRKPDVSSLRFLFSAGAALSVDLIRAYQTRHGLLVKQGFGQTETSILCCLDAEDATRKAGSVGKPVFHADVRVVRRELLERAPDAWQDCAPGEPGEIVVRGPITMLGYWRRPDATAETLRAGGWLRTGDIATVDPEGFVTLVGRARDLYISGGENVYPAEVEAAYREHPDLAEIAVVGVPDARWGEVGHAYVVLRPGVALDEPALRGFGEERLARYKLPARFFALAELPRTVTGKVQKHLLVASPPARGGAGSRRG